MRPAPRALGLAGLLFWAAVGEGIAVLDPLWGRREPQGAWLYRGGQVQVHGEGSRESWLGIRCSWSGQGWGTGWGWVKRGHNSSLHSTVTRANGAPCTEPWFLETSAAHVKYLEGLVGSQWTDAGAGTP